MSVREGVDLMARHGSCGLDDALTREDGAADAGALTPLWMKRIIYPVDGSWWW